MIDHLFQHQNRERELLVWYNIIRLAIKTNISHEYFSGAYAKTSYFRYVFNATIKLLFNRWIVLGHGHLFYDETDLDHAYQFNWVYD